MKRGATQFCQTVCTFEVNPGPCNVSVQAPSYETVSFQKTYDKDEKAMTTLSEARWQNGSAPDGPAAHKRFTMSIS
ncbi:MAG: hypothetical protein H6Q55_1666 [Deltaproteobacteria bacterium]|nr:hypothetical protein [Deltaproteobacteria bacterium]